MKEVKNHFQRRMMIVVAAVAAIAIGANGEGVPSPGDGPGCTTVAPPGTAQLLVTPVLPPLGEEPYLPGTVIVGQEIRLPADADVAWFEIHFQNWRYPADRARGAVEDGAGAKPGECEPVSPEEDVSQNYIACCTPTGCVDDVDTWEDCVNTYGGYSGCSNELCTQCPCSDPEVPVVSGTSWVPPVISKTRALPSPPCKCLVASINYEELCKILEGGTVSPPPGVPCGPVVVNYEYSDAVPGAIDYGHIAYIATLRMELNGLAGARNGSFLVELDPTETFIRDQYGGPIACTMVPAVVTIEAGGGVIPTVSEWGLVILALLLLVAAKGYFGRRAAKRV